MSFGLLRPSLLVLALPLVACSSSDDDTGGSAQPSTSLSFLTNVGNSANGTASVVDTSTLETDPSGPVISLGADVTAQAGGGLNFTITSSEPVDRIGVSVDGVSALLFTFPQPQTSVDFSCTLSSTTPAGSLELFATGARVGDADFGELANALVEVSSGSTGAQNMTVELSWNDLEDLDLALIEPDGTAQFGVVDAQPCNDGGASLETVTYASAPPTGEYIIQFFDFDSTCTEGATTSFTATVRINGSIAETFSGTTTSAQFGTEIGRFTL